MQTPRGAALALVLTLAACARTGDKTDSAAASASAAAAPVAATPAPAPPINLADVAGRWNMVATPTTGTDTASTIVTLEAKADTAGWTNTMAGGRPIPLRVRVDGDSIITSAGPYDSFRRKGVKVTTEGVLRLQGGKLVGRTVAHYAGGKGDSVMTLRMEGTKLP